MYVWQPYLPYIIGVISIYFSIGLTLNILLFFNAKLKSLDKRDSGWDEILNSTFWFIYFMVFVSFLWLPVIILFYRDQKGEEDEQLEEDPERTWWWYIKNPYRSIKIWLREQRKN